MDPNNNPATAWTAAVSQLQQDIMRQWQPAKPPGDMSALFGAMPGAMPNPLSAMMPGMMPNPMSGMMPGMPGMPGMPLMPGMPGMPGMSGVPNMAAMMGSMMPGMPGMSAAPASALASPMAAWDQYFKFSQSLTEQFKKLPGIGGDPQAQAKEFASSMDNWFRKLGGGNPLLSAFSQLLPAATGTSAASAGGQPQASGGYQPPVSAFQAGGSAFDPPAGAAPGSFQAPALGLLREHQEAWQRLSQSATKLQHLQNEFSTLWTKVGNDAAGKFGDAMSARMSGGQNFSSVMEIYNLWVECAEQCYAKVAHSSEYAQVVAALTNTVHELRLEQQRQAEGWARQLDLPTRSELNELHRQIRELRAELAEQGGPSSPRRGY